jgi:hypothetical protein
MRIPPPILHLGTRQPVLDPSPGMPAPQGARYVAEWGRRDLDFLVFRRFLPLFVSVFWVLTSFRGIAALPALRIELDQAVQVLNHSLDPRSHNQWGARNKPVPGSEQPWMARYAFNAERVRALLAEVYYKGPLRLGNSGIANVVIEAGRTTGVAEIDLIVSKAAFLELQKTLKAPTGVRILFPDPQGFKDEYRVNVRYENR